MNVRELLPRGVSEETFLMLHPILEAESLRKQQRYEEAEARYLGALEGFPEGSGGRFLIYNKLGILYEQTERLDRAVEMYKKGVDEGAVTPFSYGRLACLSMNAGSLDEASDYCDRGIKVLRRANTGFFQEVYFWLIFKSLKRKIRRRRGRFKE
jgi:tetratricopeptide (TPR) repeat protein